MRRLGAILAGGQATRFGSDKGAALLGGKALIDHVAEGLRPQVDALIICGRDWPELVSVADRPAPHLGPLGGLCAALHYGATHDFDAVVSAGCDVLPIPEFAATSGFISGHYLFGHWPVSLAAQLDEHLARESNLSLRHWIAACDLRALVSDTDFHNLNTPDDIARYAATQPR